MVAGPHLFKKGERRVGRAAGVPNKVTRDGRAILDEAFHKIGGVDRLAAWILKSPQNERLWWSQIWPRTIPISASVRGEIQHNVEMTRADLEQALRAHGLDTIAEHGRTQEILR